MKSYCNTTESGTRVWKTKNGTPHRLDGPAICYPGAEYWYVNGCFISETTLLSLASVTSLMILLKEISDNQYPHKEIDAVLTLAVYRKLLNKKQAKDISLLFQMR